MNKKIIKLRIIYCSIQLWFWGKVEKICKKAMEWVNKYE